MLWVDVLPVSPLQAATEGRVLILEGIEKAERNVLPVLNNLLENREMQVGAPLTVCMYGLHVFRVFKYYYYYIILRSNYYLDDGALATVLPCPCAVGVSRGG